MTSKLNLTAVKKYSKQYASKLCDEFYSRNDIITGKKILNLSHINQVNLFSIKQLSDKWVLEMEKIRSPYFDYEATDVKKNLTILMNALSQNIAVKRADFETILEKATLDTLMLLLDPKEYYSDQVRNFENLTVRISDLNNLEKFAKINKHIPSIIAEKIKETGADYIYSISALKWIEDIADESMEMPDRFLKLFAEKVPVEKKDLTLKPNTKQAIATEDEIDLKDPKSFFDSIYLTDTTSATDTIDASAKIEETKFQHSAVDHKEVTTEVEFNLKPLIFDEHVFEAKTQSESKSLAEVPVAQAPAVEVKLPPKPQQEVIVVDAPKVFTFDPINTAKPEATSLNDRFTVSSGMNDQVKASETLHDLHNKNKIEGLESAISLNQKFLFINRLFLNETEVYQHALNELELCKDFFEAKELILKKYVTRFNWDITGNEAEEFIEIVRRRFS